MTKIKLYKLPLLVLFCTLLTSFAQLFLKLSTQNQSLIISLNSHLIIGLLLYFVASIIFLIALKETELSILYPLLSLSYIWGLIIAIFVLDEKTKTSSLLGVGFIIIGISILYNSNIHES